MKLISRLHSLFFNDTSPSAQVATSSTLNHLLTVYKQPEHENVLSATLPTRSQPDPLPNWLTDDESLRDEGVLFGLSDARPDEKLAQIRATFAQQLAPTDEFIEQYSEKIRELNLLIEQHETQLLSVRNQANTLRNAQPAPNNLIRNVVSLCLSIVMSIGNFCLIDQTLQSSFPNRWIAIGVFLTGTFNLFGRLSFFYEIDSRLSTRRLIEEVGLPLATSLFILSHALQTQPATLAVGLFIFVFFAFLLSGKLLLSTLTNIQADLASLQHNHQLNLNKEQKLPVLESEILKFQREIDAIRMQKWPLVTALNHAEAEQAQLNAQRERLINVFLSEFELARSLRERLTEQQRKTLMNYE